MNWDDIKVSDEVKDFVRKICYEQWGLNEDGTKRNKER